MSEEIITEESLKGKSFADGGKVGEKIKIYT